MSATYHQSKDIFGWAEIAFSANNRLKNPTIQMIGDAISIDEIEKCVADIEQEEEWRGFLQRVKKKIDAGLVA